MCRDYSSNLGFGPRRTRTAPFCVLQTAAVALGRKRRVARAAIDSTGLESTSASSYFVHRRRYLGGPWKPWFTIATRSWAWCVMWRPISFSPSRRRGPKVDITEFQPLLVEVLARVRLSRVSADAGYDSEANHAFARDTCRVRSIIPAKHGRPTTKPASGRYRRLMQSRFDLDAYRDRVQVETVMSMLKRRLDGFVRGRNAWSQRRDLRLKVLTHNVMLLLQVEVFYRAGSMHGHSLIPKWRRLTTAINMVAKIARN